MASLNPSQSVYAMCVSVYYAACILASIPVMIGMTAIGTVHRWRVTLPMPSEMVGHKLVLVWKKVVRFPAGPRVKSQVW